MWHIMASPIFGVPQGFAQLLPWEGAYVTGFPVVFPMLHDEEPEPPSSGRGCRRRRRRIADFRRKSEAPQGPDVTHKALRRFSVFLRASPSSFLGKEPTLRAYLPALRVILSRRRRISVLEAYESIGSKYRSAGRLPFGSQFSICAISTCSVVHPCATSWPSSPRWEACHWIFRSLRSPTNPVPLPPQGDARDVTGLSFVSPVLDDREPKPPSSGRQKPCRGLLSRALI
jgi:hypothetical protein